MKSNADKFHLLVSTNNTVNLRIANINITNCTSGKLLGIKFDHELTFKIHALARVTSYMSISKKRIIMNAFFNSQFSYCPLVWISHSRSNNYKLNRLDECCLRINTKTLIV